MSMISNNQSQNQYYRRLYIQDCQRQLTDKESDTLKKLAQSSDQLTSQEKAAVTRIRKKLHSIHVGGLLESIRAEIQEGISDMPTEQLKDHYKREVEDNKLTKDEANEQGGANATENNFVEGKLEGVDDKWTELVPENKQSEFRRVSEMNREVLLDKAPIGKIEPKFEGAFITDITIPFPDGFFSPAPEMSELMDDMVEIDPDELDEPSDELITFELPLHTDNPKSIPIPSGFQLQSLKNEEGYAFAHQNKEFPLITRNLDRLDEPAIKAQIKESNQEIQYSEKVFKPSEKEMTYWQKVLPLPREIKDFCAEYPDHALYAVGHFIKQNFFYICEDALGKFILDHDDELPLLMDELKMGHCHLLSWATASYLRSLGQSAFVTEERHSNNEGTAFIKAGHARVGVIRNGDITFIDPSAICETFEAKYGEIGRDTIANFEEQYNLAKNEEGKRQSIRRFLQRIKRPKKKPDDLDKLESSLANLFMSLGGLSIDFETKEKDLPNIPDGKGIKYRAPARPVEKVAEHFYGVVPIFSFQDVFDLMASVDIHNFDFHRKNLDFMERLTLKRYIDFYIKMGLDPGSVYDNSLVKDAFADKKLYNLSRGTKLQKEFSDALKTVRNVEDFISILPIRKTQVRVDMSLLANDIPEISNDYQFSDYFKQIFSTELNECKNDTSSFLSELGRSFIGKALEGKIFLEDEINLLIDWEAYVFNLFLMRSLTDRQVRHRLEKEFGLTKKYFDCFAEEIQPVRGKKERHQNPRFRPPKSDGYGGLTHSEIKQKFHLDSKEIVRANLAFKRMIKKLDSSRKRSTPVPKPESWRLDPYNPEIHQVRDIEWKATARTGEVVARTRENIKEYSEPIHIVVDLMNETGNMEHSAYPTLENLVRNLKELAKSGRTIYITSTDLDQYLQIKNKKSIHPRDIVSWLTSGGVMIESLEDYRLPREKDDPTDRDLVPNLGVTSKGQVPKNLIYLSAMEGGARALDYQLGKKINLIATTFEEADLKLNYRINDEWVEYGFDEEGDENL